MKNSAAKAINKAWEGWVVTLVPYSPNPGKGLEGATSWDRDMIRRAVGRSVIRTEGRYDELAKVLGGWGYAVETPADYSFPVTA